MASEHDPRFLDRRISSDIHLYIPFVGGDASDKSVYASASSLIGNANVASKYLSLDGSGDRVQYPDSNLYSFTDGSGNDTPFSVCGWVWLNATPTGNGGILWKGRASPLAVEWALKAANGTSSPRPPIFIMYNSTVTPFMGRTTSSELSTLTWHHICGTYSGGETLASIKVYVNGVRADTANMFSGTFLGMTNTTAPLFAGGIDAPGEDLNGRLADLRIYSRVLSDIEIATIYSQGRP